jgi:hypothetical protein
MHTGFDEDESAHAAIERRWFATVTAARAKQAECEALLEVMAMAKASWLDARAQLAKLETLREALGEEMAEPMEERFVLRAVFAEETGRKISSAT